MDKTWQRFGKLTFFALVIVGATYAAQRYGIIPKAAEMLKRAETVKRGEVVAQSGIPLATNYGSVEKVSTDTGNSSGMAIGQTINYSACQLPDSSSWAADIRVVSAVGQNYGAAIGQSVF